jgi:uncharacterized protein YggT (Ycf19 family)
MNSLINLIIFLVVLDSIFSFIPEMRRHPVGVGLKKVVDFLLGPIRQLLPAQMPIDISPLILIFIIQLLASLI